MTKVTPRLRLAGVARSCRRALNSLTTLADASMVQRLLQCEIVSSKDPDNAADDETFVGKLGDGFTKLEEARLAFTDAKQYH